MAAAYLHCIALLVDTPLGIWRVYQGGVDHSLGVYTGV